MGRRGGRRRAWRRVLVEGATGAVPNPCLGLFTRHSESARKLASELRITPAERARCAA